MIATYFTFIVVVKLIIEINSDYSLFWDKQ